MNNWHATTIELESYLAGAADPVLAASLETHLVACVQCRATLADLTRGAGHTASAADSQRRWETLSAAVDEGAVSPLLRLGVATRPLIGALGVAVLLVLLIPIVVAVLSGSERLSSALLAGAPLAPMLATAFAFRRDTDPAGELTLATPTVGIRLVARRALLVAGTALPVGVTGALLAGVPLAVAVGWLLPGLALAGAVLLVGTTRYDPATAAAALGSVWAIGVTIAARDDRGARVVELVTGAPTQFTALTLAVAMVGVAVARRDQIVYRSTV